MRGVVLNPMGGNAPYGAFDNLSSYLDTEIQTWPAQEWSFWQWRVNQISLESTLTVNAGSFVNGTFVYGKTGAIPVTNEAQICQGNTGYEAIESGGGSDGWRVDWMKEYFRQGDAPEIWQGRLEFSASTLISLVTYRLATGFVGGGGSLSAAVLRLEGYDPVLDVNYARTVDLYEESGATWAGELVIRPVSFYEYSDGLNPKYDAATGALIPLS